MAAAPPVLLAEAIEESKAAVFGQLQEIRSEAQDVLRAISEIEAKRDIVDTASRRTEIDLAFATARVVIGDDIDDIDERQQEIENLLRAGPGRMREYWGDELRNISNYWDRVKIGWRDLVAAAPTGDKVLPPLIAIRSHLERLRNRIGFLTIPRRLNDHLAQLHIGQGLDFHGVFEDELPSEEERLSLLRMLRGHPAAISGVVDVEKGKVFRASNRTSRRVVSLALIGLALVANYPVMYVIARWVPDLAVPGASAEFGPRWSKLAAALTAMIIGGVAHIFVGALKEKNNRSSEDAFLAVDGMLVWAHVREVQLIISALSFSVAMIGMVLILKRIDAITAFFVGYSIDSFIDLFLQRFEKTATSQVASIQEAAA